MIPMRCKLVSNLINTGLLQSTVFSRVAHSIAELTAVMEMFYMCTVQYVLMCTWNVAIVTEELDISF